MRLPLLVALSLLLGLPLVLAAPAWGRHLLAAWNLALLGLLVWRSAPDRRRTLLACLALAWAGELLLGEAWDLYDYASPGIPAYIPPGHVLVFASALVLAPRAPRHLPALTAVATLAYTALALASGLDTAALLWAPVLLACLAWGRDRALYATMAWVALAIELWGTALGAWTWHGGVPGTPLVTPNPPVLAGCFYCLLDLLSLALGRLGTVAWPTEYRPGLDPDPR